VFLPWARNRFPEMIFRLKWNTEPSLGIRFLRVHCQERRTPRRYSRNRPSGILVRRWWYRYHRMQVPRDTISFDGFVIDVAVHNNSWKIPWDQPSGTHRRRYWPTPHSFFILK
jgi:hypothetical protein